MAIAERELLKADAFRMTQRLTERLRDPHVTRQPQYDLPSAVRLIHNYVHRFNQPALAVEFALDFHNTVELWGVWGAWAEALDTFVELDDLRTAEWIQVLIYRSRAAQGTQEYAIATSNALVAFEQATACALIPLVAKALNQLAKIAFEQDDYVQAREYLEQALGLDNTQVSSLDLGHININLGNIAVQQERLTEVHEYFDKAMFYYQRSNSSIHIAKVAANKADFLRREGKLDQACTALHNVLATFQVHGARYDHALAQNSLGCIYLQTKQWEEASYFLQSALRELDELGALATKAWVLTNVIELYVKTHQHEEVERASAEAYELAKLCNRPLVTAGVHVDYGVMLFEQGEHEKARLLWVEALDMQETHGATALASYTRSLLLKLPPQCLTTHIQ
jgi:tetratricopeptide (TPR) repeat protein